jgi:hypothetical protein
VPSVLTQYDELRAARGRAASTSSYGATDTSAALFGESSGFGPALDAVSLRGGEIRMDRSDLYYWDW